MAVGVALLGNYVFLANSWDGVRIYDVSKPSNPVNVGHTATDYGGSAISLVVAGKYLYVANMSDGLRIFSVCPSLNIALTNSNDILFAWSAPLGSFALQQSSNLCANTWLTMTDAVVAVNSQYRVVTPQPPTARYYRLRSQ